METESVLAPGARVLVRDEEWLVRSSLPVATGGYAVRVFGMSELVRNQERSFLTALDEITEMRPEDTELVTDTSPQYRRSRLYLESLLRRTPPTDDLVYLGHQAALNFAKYQLAPAHRALAALKPSIGIFDGVGIGKTLEVGILLSELIKRGRGERILVVALKSILAQFQQELWSRFCIPLVRLDTEGLQRVRGKIPANKNPFYYFSKAIISIDTLKNDGRYRTYLEQCQWDCIVIDDRRIKAASTGLYYKLHPNETKAVCLTESTIPNWQEIKDTHGEYGFVFRKSEIIRLDGAPVISLPQSVIDDLKSKREAIPKTLWPYITKLQLPSPTSQRKIDFLHEREWRVPQDICFDTVQPYAVVFSKERPGIEGEELILQAAREFQELSESETISNEDVSVALRNVPHLDKSKIKDESETVHAWLLRNGVRTRDALTAFVSSTAIFEFLAQVYVEELRRPADMPLDPTAVGTWGAFLYVNGLRDDNKELVIGQIRQTPEYLSVHHSDNEGE